MKTSFIDENTEGKVNPEAPNCKPSKPNKHTNANMKNAFAFPF